MSVPCTPKPACRVPYSLPDFLADIADPRRAQGPRLPLPAVLAFKCGHWRIDNGYHYLLDWNWDEDRCTLRTGHGPQNITALRRFAIGAIRSKSRDTVAATLQPLALNVRLVFDYLRMTDNSRSRPPSPQMQAG